MIDVYLKDGNRFAVAGHLNPDGDCIGSCSAMVQYIRKCRPDAGVDLYLEDIKPVFSYLKGCADRLAELLENACYDRLFLLDTSSPERIGVSAELINRAKETVVIDHHISNEGFGDVSFIRADASSASEVLYDLLDPEKIDREIAASLYTGIIHDTGVFQYSCTGPHTMEIAGKLIGTGIPFSEIIENTFKNRTFTEMRVLGHILERAETWFDGQCIFSSLTDEEMRSFGVTKKELDGVPAILRETEGAELSVFLYAAGTDAFKVSFRSKNRIDVSALAASFGGGGHIRAAGCTVKLGYDEAKEAVLSAVKQAIEALPPID